MSDEMQVADKDRAEPTKAKARGTGDEAPRRAAVREAVPARPSRLRDAMRRARLNEAERRDVVTSLRESELARLELLQEAIADVFAELPEDSDLFGAHIVPGSPPRLWIDVLAYVEMARDRQTYRFVQEARHGRHILLEAASVEDMSARITDYVAHRLLERKRALAAEELALAQTRLYAERGPEDAPAAKADKAAPATSEQATTAPSEAPPDPVVSAPGRRGASVPEMIAVFLLGMLTGAAILFVYALSQFPD